MKKILCFLYFTVLIFSTHTYSKEMHFTAKDMRYWSVRYFLDKTLYTVVNPDSQVFQNVPKSGALYAKSLSAASSLFYKEKIDLNKTPWLSWSWRVETFPTIKNEKSKKGDDFAGRMYIVFNEGTVLSTKGISYVWSQQSNQGEVWKNPFAGEKNYMVAVEASKETGVWRHAQRNIKQDLRDLFGEDIRYLAAIAIMTDSDNSFTQSEALYADIRLTKDKYVFQKN